MTDLRTQLQTTLGDGYTLERELGGGGMSRVFVARENALGREVVVKVLSPDLAASVSAERFTREIATAARLQQANIVPVLSAGTASGVSYYTMPFVKGESLRAQLARGVNLSMHDRLNVLRDVARALVYAHGEGVIHRDIKPDNILLSGGTAVVTDFGIAKAISASRTLDGTAPRDDNGTLTQVGSSIGTPAYMAPEQAVGESVDARADLYAWGVVAYELLSGAHPFAGKTGTSQLIAAHLTETPRPLADVAPTVPRDVSALVMQCLEKNPAQRPADATALLSRLSTVTTPNTEPPKSSPPLPPFPLRFKIAVPVVALALVAAAAIWLTKRAPAASPASAAASDTSAVRSLVVLPFESVGGDTANSYFAEGMADELSNALTKLPGLQLAGRSSAATFRGKQKSAQEIGAALNVGGVLEGTVRRADGKIRVSTQLTNARTGRVLWSESFERGAKDVFAVQDDIAKAIVHALQVTLAGGASSAPLADRGTDDLEAYDLYQRGIYLYGRRGPSLFRARSYFDQAIARDPKFARAFAALALTWIQMGSYRLLPMGEGVVAPAAAASERAVALDSMSADSWAALGQARMFAHRWPEADEATHRAVRLDARNAVAQSARARLLSVVGRLDEAAEAALAAVRLDPASVGYFNLAAQTLSYDGRYPEAIRFANRLWEADSTFSASTASMVLLEGGQPAEARRRADVMLRTALGVPTVAAEIYIIAKAGDPDRARALLTQQRARFASEGEGGWTTAWLGLGDTARALTAAEVDNGFGVSIPLASRVYDPLRASPRFAAIVRQLGLDVALLTSPNGGRPR